MILVVDDELYFMKPLTYSLEAEGLKTLEARTASECLNLLRCRKDIEVVILDVMMPPGEFGLKETNDGLRTGLVLLREIRKDYPDLPVFLLTKLEGMDEASSDVHTVVLSKIDITPRELVRLVKESTNKKS